MFFKIIIVLFAIVSTQFAISMSPKSDNNCPNPEQAEVGEPLFLSPLIEAGLYEEAQQLARVRNLTTNVPIESYSGFITVNPDYNSNIFFWYFPAINGNKDAPVVLWLEGGPAISVQLPLFTENGPFTIENDFTLTVKNTSWAQTHSMIYIESPVGTGFSFVDKAEGFDKSANDTAINTYEFLLQFYRLFPQEQRKDFYIGGVSYGGHYVPALAYEIHSRNAENSTFKIPMKGFVIESPWTEPGNQILYSEYLYQLGFVNETIRDELEVLTVATQALVNQGKYDDARIKLGEMMQGPDSLFSRATNLTVRTIYNYVLDVPIERLGYFEEFVQLPSTRLAIHVGNATYAYFNATVSDYFNGDVMKSYRGQLEALLDASENYRIVLYVGQMDIWTGYKGLENMIGKMQWSGAEEFSKVERTSWSIDDYVVGFSKTVKNFTYILVRNAGHSISRDQTAVTHDLIQRVTKNVPF